MFSRNLLMTRSVSRLVSTSTPVSSAAGVRSLWMAPSTPALYKHSAFLQAHNYTSPSSSLHNSNSTRHFTSSQTPQFKCTSTNNNDQVAHMQYPEDAQEDSEWVSRATKDVAISRQMNITGSAKKMAETCRMIKGLSVDEALVQLRFCQKKNSQWIYNALSKAKVHAIHNYYMDPERLVVAYAMANKGKCRKMLNIHARGRFGIRLKYMCHVTVGVKELPPVKGEKKLGRHGRTHSTISRTMDLINKRKGMGGRKEE